EPAPDRQIVSVAERPHLAGVFGARREGEEAGAAAVAESAVERQRPGFAPQFELDVGDGELIVVAGQTPNLVDWNGLTHVPVAAPLVAVPVSRRGGADLKEHLAVAKLGRPGTVNVGLRHCR